MLARSVIQIIERMGFIYEDENRWVADFMCDSTGDIVTIVAYEDSDEYGFAKILFDNCDDCGNLRSTITLDQMMLEYERNIRPVPRKSDKKYKVELTMQVEMAVDMNAIFPETYRMYIEDGERYELDIAQLIAKADLTEYCNGAPFSVTDIDINSVEEVI